MGQSFSWAVCFGFGRCYGAGMTVSHGKLTRPDRPALAWGQTAGDGPTIVFFPGYASDMSGSKAQALFDWAPVNGCNCLLFDYAGCGQSGGRFEDETLETWRDDALDIIADRVPRGPLILVGSSMGGWLMLLVVLALNQLPPVADGGVDAKRTGGPGAHRPSALADSAEARFASHPPGPAGHPPICDGRGVSRVAALVGIAAAPDFTDWGYSAEQKAALARDGRLYEDNPYGPEPTLTTLALWQSGERNLLLDGLIALDCPVRLLHGQADGDVPFAISLRLAASLRSAEVRTLLIKDGDHRLSRPQDIALLIATVDSLLTEGIAQ